MENRSKSSGELQVTSMPTKARMNDFSQGYHLEDPCCMQGVQVVGSLTVVLLDPWMMNRLMPYIMRARQLMAADAA